VSSFAGLKGGLDLGELLMMVFGLVEDSEQPLMMFIVFCCMSQLQHCTEALFGAFP